MIRDITIGQYYPQSSVIHRLDPRVKLLGTVLFVISVFLIHSVPAFIIVTAAMVALIALSKVPVSFMLKGLKSIFMIILLTFCFSLFLTRQFIQDRFFECNCTGIKDRSLYGHASELSDYWLISDDIDHNTEPADRWS